MKLIKFRRFFFFLVFITFYQNYYHNCNGLNVLSTVFIVIFNYYIVLLYKKWLRFYKKLKSFDSVIHFSIIFFFQYWKLEQTFVLKHCISVQRNISVIHSFILSVKWMKTGADNFLNIMLMVFIHQQPNHW